MFICILLDNMAAVSSSLYLSICIVHVIRSRYRGQRGVNNPKTFFLLGFFSFFRLDVHTSQPSAMLETQHCTKRGLQCDDRQRRLPAAIHLLVQTSSREGVVGCQRWTGEFARSVSTLVVGESSAS